LFAAAASGLGVSCTREPSVEGEAIAAPAPVRRHPPNKCTLFAAPATSTRRRDLPRSVWRQEIRQAYDFLRNSKLAIDLSAVRRPSPAYYEDGAPEELAPADFGPRAPR